MTINLTREDFEQAIKSGASVFEGNTIPDTGKPSGATTVSFVCRSPMASTR